MGPGLRSRAVLPAILAGMLLAACGNTARNADAPELPVVAQAGSGGGGAGGLAGAGGVTLVTQAVPGDMHRLSAFEYAATVHDVLATDAPELAVSVAVYNGFDNSGAAQSMHEQDFDEFYRAARAVAHTVFTTPALKARVVACQGSGSVCSDSLLDQAGLHLFRRPLSAEERAVYLALYSKLRGQGLDGDAALEQLLVALLASAQFLYRIELSSQQPEPLEPYELAARLSYLLWSSAPDDPLLEAARVDELAEDAQLEAQLARMWDDARSARFVQSFAGQWLGARRLLEHEVDAQVFPMWNAQVAAAAGSEIYASFDNVLRNDRELLDLYRPTPHDIDGALAPLYGMAAVSGGSVRLEGERASYLGSVGFFTLTSWYQRSSPTLRGHDILDNLLCEHLPPPPPAVPAIDPLPPNATFRENVDRIRENATCRPCHALMDPLGLALEHYDAIGQYRDSYANGEPIDTRMQLGPWPGYPQGLLVDGLAGVIERVVTDPAAKRCAAEKLYSYAIGGGFDDVDKQNIDVITAGWEQGRLSVKELTRQIVSSKTFRFKLARKVGR